MLYVRNKIVGIIICPLVETPGSGTMMASEEQFSNPFFSLLSEPQKGIPIVVQFQG